jgi:ferredoxin
MMKLFLVNVVGLIIVSISGSFAFAPSKIRRANGMKNGNGAAVAGEVVLLRSAPADSDFEEPIPVKDPNSNSAVDENVYNVDAEAAADIWTVSVSPDDRLDRAAGVPFLDSKSKNHYVDDVRVVVRRDGGMGIELLELAGGRDDDYGLTIVSGVSGNAEKAGIIAGDSITSVEIQKVTMSSGGSNESREMFDCECKNFDTTISLLGSFPPEIESIVLNLKRIRRWPKINVVVEYPPIQCAEGVSNKETVELFAGENLKRALQNRGIIFEDRDAGKCDFCGGKCTVAIDMGMQLMNPMGITEEKLMKRNPKCRLSCKTVVGYNMQEGDVRLRINLNEWTADDKKSESRNPFFSK